MDQDPEAQGSIPDKEKDYLEIRQILAGVSTTVHHTLVELTKKRLENVQSSDNGILVTPSKGCLDVRVSGACLDRALTFLDKLFAVLKQRGFSVAIEDAKDYGRSPTSLRLIDEVILFHIEEKVIRTPHTLTDAEKQKLARKKALYGAYYSHPDGAELVGWEPPYWDYQPFGLLQFKIDNLQATGQRQIWSETASRSLDDLLPAIILHIIQAAAYLRERRIEREESERRRTESERQQLAVKQRIEHLDKLVERWSKREQLMRFLTWVDDNMPDEERTAEFVEWYKWAKSYAERLNPLTKKEFFSPDQQRYRY